MTAAGRQGPMSRREPFDYYDAEHWAERTAALLHREKLALALLEDVLTAGVRVLDVGCGNGLFLDRIRRSTRSSVRCIRRCA